MLHTILFDLDGTLLPMDMERFTKAYFEALAQKCAAYGYAPDKLVPAVWAGTKAMVQNDGSAVNEDRFWAVFAAQLGPEVLTLKHEFESFYANEFHAARTSTGANPDAAPVVRALREKGYTLVLASNPIFPAVGFASRLSWIGLSPADFDHVTTYEQYHACKPNLDYYREILANVGKNPADCLMVGNDIREDGCVTQLGMACRLVTDCLLGDPADIPAGVPTATFAETRAYLESLPSLGG